MFEHVFERVCVCVCYSLHHGGWYGAAVLYGGERGGEVGGVGGLHHLLVPVHHIQVAVKLLPNLLGQLHKGKAENVNKIITSADIYSLHSVLP